jgi:cell wall-associated NlpC family hydrolase
VARIAAKKDGFDAVDAAILIAKRGSMGVAVKIILIILAICLVFFALFVIAGAHSAASSCGDIGNVGGNGNDNTKIVFEFLEGQPELTPVHAAGMTANLSYESGGQADLSILLDNPDPNSGATGMAHWTSLRLAALKTFGPRDWRTNIYTQLAFFWHELRDEPATSGNALAIVRRTTNVADATTRFEAAFERSGNVASYADRISTAQKILNKYGGEASSLTEGPFSCDGLDVAGDASASAVKAAADALDAMHVPYNYGGGHVDPAKPGPGQDGAFDGLDCSAAVSWVLQHAGLKIHTMASPGFMEWSSWGGKPGPGKYVTIYANPTHVFMKIGRRYFGTSGFGHPEAGGGAAWFTRPVPTTYLNGFMVVHPDGL